MFVVFDMDGTLSDDRHRLRLLPVEPKSDQRAYAAYHAACALDLPVAPALRSLAAHAEAGHRVEIWTGRCASQEGATRAWLARQLAALRVYGLALEIRMRMRSQMHGGMSTVEIKRSWLRSLAVRPQLAYDDRPEIAAMFREHGVVCYLVQ